MDTSKHTHTHAECGNMEGIRQQLSVRLISAVGTTSTLPGKSCKHIRNTLSNRYVAPCLISDPEGSFLIKRESHHIRSVKHKNYADGIRGMYTHTHTHTHTVLFCVMLCIHEYNVSVLVSTPVSPHSWLVHTPG